MRGEDMTWWLAFGEGAVLLLMFSLMPVMGGARAFFGARVDEATMRGRGRAILRRYRWTVAAAVISIQACGYLLAVRYGSPLPALFAGFVTLAVGAIIYNKFAREVRPLAARNEATRFASSLRGRRLADYTCVPVEAVVLTGTLLPLVLLAYFYPQLPDPVPVHWNAAGAADAWAAKSATTIFFLPALGIYLQVVFLVLKHDLAAAKMTLPAEHTAEYLRGKNLFLRANVRTVDWARVSIVLLFLCISMLMVTSGVQEWRAWQPVVIGALWVAVALMVGGIFYQIWQASRANVGLQESIGDWYAQRPADEARWQGGGLNYNNPDDPALMVEKLIGVGYTYNTAHPAFRTRLALLAGAGLFVVWAASSL